MKYFTVATMKKSTRIKRTKTDIKKDCSVPRGGDMLQTDTNNNYLVIN